MENFEKNEGKLNRILQNAFSMIAIVMSCYHIYAVIRPTFSPVQHSNIHLAFALVLVYLSGMLKREKKLIRWIDFAFLVSVVISTLYIQVNYLRLTTKVGLLTGWDKVIGILLLVVVIEASRRTFGNVLPALVLLSLLYLRFGNMFSGFFYHAGFSWQRIVSTMTTSFTGIYGSILDISATFIVIFMIFGGLLDASGAGRFFIQLALSVAGRLRSGPAQAAIIGSCLVGSINGSAVANVATTGVFTIPLMKRCGYKPEMAGALEAVASTGGMIMPPIMGVGAFVMAGITGIPYATIALGALIPALLYYITAGMTAHLYAVKHNFRAMEKAEIPNLAATFKEGGHFIIPMAVIVYFMAIGTSVMRSGFYGITSLLLVVIIKESLTDKKYLISKKFYLFLKDGMISGAKSAMTVAPACAVMGILSQAMIMSGLAFKVVFFIREISGGYAFFALVLTMLISLLFGMGVPTTASYTLVAVIGASALTELGFSTLAVHLFIYYYAIMANITPPVCAAVLVASQISKSDYMRTGLTAVRVGLPGFLLPFLFMYNPELLMQGSAWLIISSSISALIGMFAMTVCFEGYMIRNANIAQRVMAGIAAATLIVPGIYSDIVGLSILLAVYLWQRAENKKILNA